MSKDYLSETSVQRFTLVDAIRGVAAFAVLFRHLFKNSVFGPRLEEILPLPIQLLSVWGAAGVYAFFVISGFVIAHSLRSNPLTRAGISNFALRRQLRLDPPYWAMIIVTLLVTLLLRNSSLSEFSFKNILINMFYLQGILKVDSIVSVAWTLCLEIQFYIIFIGLLWLTRNRNTARHDLNATPTAGALILASGIFCLALIQFRSFQAYFVSYWHYFALGVIVYWGLRGALNTRLVYAYFGLFALKMVFSNWHGINDFSTKHSLSGTAMLVGLGTALLLWWAGTHGQLPHWGKQRILQYLGRISYSLYLTHPLIVLLMLRVVSRLPQSALIAWAFWFSIPLVCIGFAHLFYLAFEKPSVAFAARLKGANRATQMSSAP